MKIKWIALGLSVAGMFVVCNVSGDFSLQAQSAKEQLEKAANTGTLFDGSDGQRFGTDTGIRNSGGVPDVPAPTAVSTSSGTAGGYSVGGSTSTAQGSANNSGSKDSGSKSENNESGKSGKTGTEPAE